MGGWQLEPFNGTFYPSTSPKSFRKLEFYSRYFDIVEVNATFYTTALTPKNAYQWVEDVSGNKEFKFSVKLFKGFTHSMDAMASDVAKVQMLLDPLAAEEKLAGLVLQFPYAFVWNDANREYLKKLGQSFSRFTLFVEVRHNSWNVPEALSFLRENNLHLVNVDLPKMHRHMPLTGIAWDNTAYFRLMGRNAKEWSAPLAQKGKTGGSENDRYFYCYDKDELNEFVKLVKHAALKMDETVVILHNDPNGNSLLNGFQLRHFLFPEKKFEAPPTLARTFPELKMICSPEPVPSDLFGNI